MVINLLGNIGKVFLLFWGFVFIFIKENNEILVYIIFFLNNFGEIIWKCFENLKYCINLSDVIFFKYIVLFLLFLVWFLVKFLFMGSFYICDFIEVFVRVKNVFL